MVSALTGMFIEIRSVINGGGIKALSSSKLTEHASAMQTRCLRAFKSGLVILPLVLSGACTQHHALNTRVTESTAFYGASGLHEAQLNQQLELASHDVTPQAYSSILECSPLESIYAPTHFLANANQTSALLKHSDVVDNKKFEARYNASLPLSPGDMIELSLVNGEGFAGDYVINSDGKIQIPYLSAIQAAGLSVKQLSEKIELELVRAGLFKSQSARAGVRVLHWAPIEVSVAGSVFSPGRVLINQKNLEQEIEQRIEAFGDFAPTRYLSEALRAASGIRPDARIDKVILIRDGWQTEVDLSGVLTGMPVNDIALVAGDQVIVPTVGCFQQKLVRPSQITPKGFRVFMSNLIETAKSNSNAAVGRFSSNIPYGSRLLQAAVSANCVGGTSWTNAPRKVLLASNNPLTGKTDVIERSVEQLVRQSHNDVMNPYLMPNDAIACYDSDVTNLRDIAKSLVDVISPFKLL